MALPGPCPLVAIAVASAVLHRCHATTLMFLDDHPLNLRVNVRRVTATPQAMSVRHIAVVDDTFQVCHRGGACTMGRAAHCTIDLKRRFCYVDREYF